MIDHEPCVLTFEGGQKLKCEQISSEVMKFTSPNGEVYKSLKDGHVISWNGDVCPEKKEHQKPIQKKKKMTQKQKSKLAVAGFVALGIIIIILMDLFLSPKTPDLGMTKEEAYHEAQMKYHGLETEDKFSFENYGNGSYTLIGPSCIIRVENTSAGGVELMKLPR